MASERERRALKQQAAESAEHLDALGAEAAALRAALEGAHAEGEEMRKALQVRTCCKQYAYLFLFLVQVECRSCYLIPDLC
jgi:hypothetical protein